MPSQELIEAMLANAPPPSPPPLPTRRLVDAMMAKQPTTVSEWDSYNQMDPIERLKGDMPSNWAPVSEDQRTANSAQNRHDLLSVIPVVGNVVAAQDAWDSAKSVGTATTDKERKIGMAGTILNTLGAFSPLPFGRMAGTASRDAGRTMNIFAGPTAKTADHAALAKAQEMKAAGVGRDAIHAETGWHQGVDGKWRFEIDDSGAGLDKFQNMPTRYGGQDHPENVGQTLFGGVHHPQLEAAYGEAPFIQGRYGPGVETRGLHDSRTGFSTVSAPDHEMARSVALHELQHGAQRKEGFATGVNPSYLAATGEMELSPAVLQINGRLRRAERGTPEYDALMQKKIRAENEAAYGPYHRTSGEVEARNVQARMNMTAAERRAKAPWFTQDVPDEQQIVRHR